MKRKLVKIVLALCLAVCMLPGMANAEETDVAIDATTFPDANFRSYVKTNFDTDKDGSLSVEEISNITSISLYKKNISALKGIEYFTELRELFCSSNNLTELDLSKNTNLSRIDCSYNKLTRLNINKAAKLYELDCRHNALTELDLSQNTELRKIYYGDNQLTSLDVNKVSYMLITDYLYGDNNEYMVKGTTERRFDLSDLPGKFDVSKIKSGIGGTVNGTILTFNDNSDTYEYYYIVRDSNAWGKKFKIKLHTHTKYGSWVSNGDGTHTKTCATSGCGFTETEICTGGTAKCNAKAICSVCKGKYGTLNANNHVGENNWMTNETAHKRQWDCCEKISVPEAAHTWDNGICTVCAYACGHKGGMATCVNKAVCEICGQAYGEVNSDNHSGQITWIQTAENHAKGYTCCGRLTGGTKPHRWNSGVCTECDYVCKHSGGIATCVEQANCEICGEKYGGVDISNHAGKTEVRDAKAATCTENGYTGDTYCKSCNAKISSGSEIAALGHEKSEAYKYDKKTHWKTCLRDGCMEIFDIADHTGGIATVDKPSQCEICKQPYGKCLPGLATIFGTSVTGKPGREITVDMNLVENTGIASMLVEIEYDKSVLEFVSAENGDVFDIGSFNGPDTESNDKVLTWQNGTLTQNITETGKLAVLKFKVKEEATVGSYEIVFKCRGEKYEAIDSEMNAVNVIADASKVTIVKFFFGDVDGNDKVDSSDALQLRRYLAKWKAYGNIHTDAANLDMDDAVTLRDITILQRHIAGWRGYETLPITEEILPIP